MKGDKVSAVSLIIFGPIPSKPVALDGSKNLIYDKTCD